MPSQGSIGERVRALRIRRHLSQAQLAGSDLSDSYISLIESNKRTPTPAVIQLLAERLGCSPEFIAEGVGSQRAVLAELRIRLAEAALLAGDAKLAHEGFQQILVEPGADLHELHRRARTGLAASLEGLGRLEEAITTYEQLRADASRWPDRMAELPLLVALCRCHRDAGDLMRCVELGEEALGWLDRYGLDCGHELTELSVTLVDAYLDQGNMTAARSLAERVSPRLARAVTPRERVEAYRVASLAARDQDRLGDALYLAEQAVTGYEEARQARDVARLRLGYAWLLLHGPSAEPRRAAEVLTELEPELTRLAEPALRAAAKTELARAHVLLDEPARAVALVGETLAILDRELPSIEGARAHLVLGEARMQLADRQAALSSFQTAARQLELIPPCRAAAQAWRELGDVLGRAGDHKGMTGAYRRALACAGLHPSPRTHQEPTPAG